MSETETKTVAELLQDFAELKLVLENVEGDVEKAVTKGNKAAGKRVRASLRDLKKQATQFSRDLIALEKAVKEKK